MSHAPKKHEVPALKDLIADWFINKSALATLDELVAKGGNGDDASNQICGALLERKFEIARQIAGCSKADPAELADMFTIFETLAREERTVGPSRDGVHLLLFVTIRRIAVQLIADGLKPLHQS
jgi:hypothetical protein